MNAPSDALRLDRILLEGDDRGRPYRWLTAFGSGPAYPVIAPRVSEFLRLPLLEALGEWAEGRAKLCPHAPSIAGRDVAIAASVRPGYVCCMECEAHALHRRQDESGWAVCSLCGTPSTQVVSVTFGSMTYRAPVCGGCEITKEIDHGK